eukprot:CAMPEP_0206180590 /NCGR_PEP_ID=MMETSP1474-20131121/68100_1 /ASSEMBLY_ACC=CAM_ASM_001110 /TAXON_ID=97495 /ORGANISM="Imantonia sp., Strain RCC918" /LENGTH=210 /DNA_ID=CAMNT_0053594283 /DNA_START=438 /DNA_END=1066 /DNA_ORIENTATION=-
MTVNNIAMVMNPSMFRDDNNSVLEFMSMGPARSKLVKTLIENYEEMFLLPKENLQTQVEAREEELSEEVGVQLKNFSSLLQKGALAIANLLMQEGEKEIAIQFDETEDVVATKQTKRVLTDDDVKNMSFEEFAKFMQINPPGSGNPMERGKRSGTNRLVSTDPVALTTDSSDESKHNSGEKRKLNETQRSCSMSTLEGGPNGNVGEIETG